MSIYATTDDRQRAVEIVERLRLEEHRSASVQEVLRMQNPPRTSNRYAVVVDE